MILVISKVLIDTLRYVICKVPYISLCMKRITDWDTH